MDTDSRGSVYDTRAWTSAWAASTIERQEVLREHDPPTYLLDYSPFWHGYEIDTGLGPTWKRPLVTIGSVYSVFGPEYLAADETTVAHVVEDALGRARDREAHGVLVLNLREEFARRWSACRPPALTVRLDNTYYRVPGEGADPVMGDLSKSARTDWRRRWRRATEAGVRIVEERSPSADAIEEIIGFANGSAIRHGWPVLYDLPTMQAVLATPYGRLFRAEFTGRTVGGFLALEHDGQLHLWVGGMDHTAAREASPYLFLLYELLSPDRESRWRRIEFGRGNDDFKRKYGFREERLWSLWYPATEDDAEFCEPRLRALHGELARCQHTSPEML
ncbi:GNAT family N-acetyltransferase [Amycolatopsis sp. QT-25]|uniref:GNAT family N-acetyltransferase n=1 Tax=Amycolatopsis sp. QT-25 TaxID=3034022 RepID=UPI0023EADC5D|nr:GNAT family N-acetyltransferase [Amycolatopsis sp. QT-25]WET76269.1 GNAT family N-acetyltransferase [Amycolatopsis sp. QT-25]